VVTEQRILPFEELCQRLVEHQAQGVSVVFTNGCFDLLHPGHVGFLEEASALGDVLVVAINSDTSVRAVKGEGRPIIPEADRARMLAALACVNYVTIFDEPTPLQLLKRLRPDVLVKGGTTDYVVGADIVRRLGGRVVLCRQYNRYSTTGLAAEIAGRPAG
jgi:D-beta-D-heptose 7-phosphate kinase/D-beta-D-heptose 1-phosphate adenosyltransferase